MHVIAIDRASAFSSLTFSPDSALLAVVAPHHTVILDPLHARAQFSAGRGSRGASFYWGGSHDRTLFVSDYGRGLHALDADAGVESQADRDWPGSLTSNAIVTRDGSFVVSVEQDDMGGEGLCCWRRADGGMILDWTRLVPEPVGHSDRRLAFSLPDGERFVYTEQRHSNLRRLAIVLVNRTVETAIDEGTFPHSLIGCSAVSPRGDWFGFGQTNGASCYLYRTDDVGLKPVKLTNKNRTHVNALAFHPAGRILATAGNDGTVNFHDTVTWQVVKTFDWNVGRLQCVAFSPDGALAAVGSDKGKVVVWDVDV